MSKKATEFQRKAMSWMYRGKEIFKPLNTGWIDKNVACVREWVANIFFYRKGDTTIMVNAGYNYDRLAEKMGWLGIDPKSIHHILITHQDTDHVGAVEADSDKRCSPFKKRVHDPSAPYDAYDESDDTEENAKSGFLKGVGR